MGPYILRAHTALLLLVVSASPRSSPYTGKRAGEKLITRRKMKLLIVCALMTVAVAGPGLLRVPKVYNAVITSNQNLSPSRAFPVIQPIVHRTAVGYVPPFYYTQIAPHFAGPEVVPYSSLGKVADDNKVAGNDQASSSTSRLAESSSFGIANERNEDHAKTSKDDESRTDSLEPSKNSSKKNEQVPLSFYPNYQSLYYEPYIYTYNGFNPHLVPGTYYVDYQPYGSLEPIPATTPRNVDSGHLLPSFHDEKTDQTGSDKEKIPNVPPPPLPTSVPKKS
ncbi:uncharacterized protein LOC114929191 [Nylanderia fulva]|uniref:uncharacterized protein LOC114929191 n=1 Tax=Nylanderia fulva TaxID=613905 RepID=UPI0010FB8430|nr:uncharacterized protein LOC114929191 [Nylanderia fulva]